MWIGKMTAEILEFPKERIKKSHPDFTSDEVKAAKLLSTENFAEDVCQEIIQAIHSEFRDAGLNTNSNEEVFHRDFSFLVGSVRGCVFRMLNLEHPMHMYVDENLEVLDDLGENVVDFEATFDPNDDGDEYA
jgi:hypothetical protein